MEHVTSTTEHPSIAHAADGELLQFLTFTVADSEYGVDIMSVREIKGWAEITRLPNRPDYMRGVMNLRGVIIPIFDLRCRFGQGQTHADEKNVVIILAVEERIIGILVDTVSDIVHISRPEIKPAPRQDENALSERFIDGLIAMDNRMVVLLQINQLFRHDEVDTGAGVLHSSDSHAG
ncbi:MAG: chemotaxis protein CheW [Rickettsiales bacterium]|nr:chemotaxis protein CheW [Rickettsiales bacterium]